jgi:hypothetical protein
MSSPASTFNGPTSQSEKDFIDKASEQFGKIADATADKIRLPAISRG